MNSYREQAEQRIIQEQAAHWLCELAEGEVGQREAFAAWLKRSPRHVGEFLMASMAWKEFGRAGVISRADIEQIVVEAQAQDLSNVVTLPAEARAGHSSGPDLRNKAQPHRRGRAARIAAGVATLALGLLGVARLISGSHIYTTEVGEQRTVRLVDGSLMHLNTDSRVKVTFSEQAREVHLLAGEALFTVERDPARPFSVDAGSTVIRAIGTQFDVYRRSTGITVSVVEGIVQVSKDNAPAPDSEKLSAGEQATVAADGQIYKRSAPNIVATALAWRERRLVFQDDRLEDIATEVNRYTPRRIRLQGDGVRDRRITGTFDADNPESLILFLRKLDTLSVEATDEEFVVSERSH